MSVINGNSSELIVKNGLILNLDAGNRKSYISGSDTWIDLSGNNNNGSLINGPTFDATNGGNIVFDGVNDFASASISTTTSSIYSVSLWAYPTANTVGAGVFSSNGYSQGGPNNNVFFQIGGGPKPWQFNNAYPNTSVNINTWYHLTGVQTSTNQYLYVNGALVASASAASTSGNTFNFGKRTDNVYFTGKISSAQIHLNKALSASEVLQNYNANKSRFATSSLSISNVPKVPTNGLILSLDAANAKSYVSGSNTIYDLSGNNNSGSLKNGTFFTSSFGGGFVFDGVDDYILTPLNIDANPYTVSAWCYPYNTSGARGIFLTDNQDWDKGVEINNGYWAIHVGNTLVFTGVPASVNTWYNCCIVYATDNIYFYVNGIKVWTFGEPPRSTSGSTIEIGRANYGSGTRFFTGVVSTLTAYNRVLSNSEITGIYNATKGRYGL